VMQRLGARAFVKGGAEGVYCAAFPDQGLGLALKIDDGAKRGAEAVAAFIIAGLFKDEVAGASELFDMRVTNWRGTQVGKIRPSDDLKGAIEPLSG
jgi:L-asparaginase II